jgi:PAS domain S-box-containing protein
VWEHAWAEAVYQGRPPDATPHTGERPFQHLLQNLPAGAYTCDPKGLITYYNPQALQLWGRAPELNNPADRFCGSFKLFSPEGDPISHDACWMALALKQNQAYNGHEIVIERPDGQRLTVLAYANPIHDASGMLLGAVNVLVDITDRKRTEMALRESEARLQAALREKEVLLKEIHHRVKNNLQVVSSLLSLQHHTIKDPTLRELFHESERRVRSMALIHETLYQAPDVSRFDLSHYLRTLGTELFRAYGVDPARVRLSNHIEEVVLPLDTALPCGLILNELLSNALKHAFPDGRRGDIRIELQALPDHQVVLRIVDTGIGLPNGLDIQQTSSLGLQLVCALTEQLQGTLTVGQHNGTVFTLVFSLATSAS